VADSATGTGSITTPAPAIRRVTVIGAGRIGLAIVGHLVRGGFTVVAHDVDPSRREAAIARGAAWAAALDQAAGGADAVLICVGYDRQLRALAPSLLDRARPGTIVAVLATVHPRTVRELSAAAKSRGIDLVDATLCRGGRGADEGTLLSFVGGDPGIAARLRPVLACFCSDIVASGAVGSAQAAKAANNLIMWACLVANHEALALAQRYGVDVELLRRALLETGASNGVLRHWGTSTMAWADDDLDLIQQMADEAGVQLPQAALDREICRTLKPKKFQLDRYGV
jgi:3-hydroxyisobutyrate dehydrogenase-like beta-hydroxyacid dehydrogenase